MAVDLDAIRKKVQELQSGRRSSNVQLWKPKEAGEYVVRALPWPDSVTQPGQPFVERWFYYIGDNFGVLTPHQFGKKDPIKEFIDSLWASGKPEDREIAKKLRPKMQAYLPVVVKKGGKDADPNKVLVWSINKFIYQKMLSWFLDAEIGDYLDPNEGFDIKVTLTDAGKKFKGKTVLNNDVELARKPSKLAASPEEAKKIIDAIPNIDNLYEMKSPEELKRMLERWMDGGAAGDDETSDRGGTDGGDALDKLANDLKSETKEEVEEATAKPEKEEKSKKKSKKTTEDEPVKQSLDEAFEELMADG